MKTVVGRYHDCLCWAWNSTNC